ncbi:MAG: LLM class flavin-dependent oxidoreductase [Deltaproteobacteria bacterium]|nr:LLM class flavin-dependent oxidoreductase [Deltaproteobacteria bacterium]
MNTQWPLRFGVFLPPMHPVGQNPTLTLQRDIELIEHLDRLGFDEAWIGEHHSAGYETIASPEVFIGVVSQRTRHIKLGTGVISLPYHHPLLVADNLVLLDHLTRGRVMFGVGPGQLTSDAIMLGIAPDNQRRMMQESFEVIMALLNGETVTRKTDWFTINEGVLQLRPYSYPRFDIAVAASISPAGATLAGRFGVGLLSLAATNPLGFQMLHDHWQVAEEQAAKNGQTVDRRNWRMVGPMHIAETKEQALADCRFGFLNVMTYLSHILPMGQSSATTYEDIVKEMNETGAGVIGTPDMAIAQIKRIQKQSGGFGCYLTIGADFADWQATLRSYELISQYVMPHFKGQSAPPQASYDRIIKAGGKYVSATAHAIEKAIKEYDAGQGKGKK